MTSWFVAMSRYTRKRTKTHGYRAQAMLEFALTLMILLVVVIGLLEVGRLIFMYAAVITAGREAVRYGSTVGLNAAGKPYYQDCVGIENAARRAAFLVNIDSILIQYDQGPGSAVIDTCDDIDNNTDGNPDGVDEDIVLNFEPAVCTEKPRILVTISSSYDPVVSITPITHKDLVASTARTIMGIIELGPVTTSPPCN